MAQQLDTPSTHEAKLCRRYEALAIIIEALRQQAVDLEAKGDRAAVDAILEAVNYMVIHEGW